MLTFFVNDVNYLLKGGILSNKPNGRKFSHKMQNCLPFKIFWDTENKGNVPKHR